MNQQTAEAGTPLATSMTSPVSNTQGKIVGVDVLHLDDLPGAMDNMGWKTSAAMMRRWFSTAPAYAMPQAIRGGKAPDGQPIDYTKLPSSQVDDQIIKMKWAQGFERMRKPYEDLRRNWDSAKGKDALRERLLGAGWSSGKTIKLGTGLTTAMELDMTSQVNFRTFGGKQDELDDLFGAVFSANLKLAVVGKASRSWIAKKDRFEVEKVGVYLRDTYDFNTSWYEDAAYGLGIWSRERVLSKGKSIVYSTSSTMSNALFFPGFVPVRNIDFRRWQAAHNSGGDFFAFSDVLWTTSYVDSIDL